MRQPVILSWSGGKDSAYALAAVQAGTEYEVVALLTSVTAEYERISVHGVRRALLHAQAAAMGLPLHEMRLEPACDNAAYQAAFLTAVDALRGAYPDVRSMAFGDLFLKDVRAYREALVAQTYLRAVFPIWGIPTDALARRVVAEGFEARLVCVDTQALPAAFAGRAYDAALLAELPPSVDPCGERGEFHTFVADGPCFHTPVAYRVGEVVLRDERFAYCDLAPA